jgi:hypothetical protein
MALIHSYRQIIINVVTIMDADVTRVIFVAHGVGV